MILSHNGSTINIVLVVINVIIIAEWLVTGDSKSQTVDRCYDISSSDNSVLTI